MKTSTKIVIIMAATAILIGIFIGIGALIAMKFDFTKLDNITYVTNTYQVEDAFTDISVECVECDVRLLPSEDGLCKVVCNESDKITHSVTVRGGTLSVERFDNRKWYERIGINLNWGKMELIVYLPQNEYGSLYVRNVAGNIDIPAGFSFAKADIRNTSGNVKFIADAKNELSAKTVSGEVQLSGANPAQLRVSTISGNVAIDSIKAETNIEAETVSGNITFTDMECRNADVESTSGDLRFSRLYASGNIHIESTSGDVRLTECDADSLLIKTISGDVSGSLLTEKIFITHTSSGDIRVPDSTSGGKCEIRTTSGDVRITITE